MGREGPAFSSTRPPCLPLSANPQVGRMPPRRLGLWSREAEGTGTRIPAALPVYADGIDALLLGSLERGVGDGSGHVDTDGMEPGARRWSRPRLPGRLTGGLLSAPLSRASPGTSSPDLFPQVAMGYAHSLVIARDESETEKEKIKKLPEYNPRTL